MQTLSVRYIYNIDNIYDGAAEDVVRRTKSLLQHKILDELDKLIFDEHRGEYLIISPAKNESYTEVLGRVEHTLSVDVGYSRTKLIEQFGGYTYHKKEVDHPSTLKFWDRVKFIFTGEYPK